LWVSPGQQWWEFANSGLRRDKPQTGDTVLDAQGSLMHKDNEGYPIWSKSTEGILWHELHKILMMVMEDNVSQNTLHRTLLHSLRPIKKKSL